MSGALGEKVRVVKLMVTAWPTSIAGSQVPFIRPHVSEVQPSEPVSATASCTMGMPASDVC